MRNLSRTFLVLVLIAVAVTASARAEPTFFSRDQSMDSFHYWIPDLIACDMDLELIEGYLEQTIDRLGIETMTRTFWPPFDTVFFYVDLNCTENGALISYSLDAYWAIRIDVEPPGVVRRLVPAIWGQEGETTLYSLEDRIYDLLDSAVRSYANAYRDKEDDSEGE